MKYFRCYYYDDYRCERVVSIVTAKNTENVKAILAKVYTDIKVSDWKIEEINFSKGYCEVYYG